MTMPYSIDYMYVTEHEWNSVCQFQTTFEQEDPEQQIALRDGTVKLR